MRLITICVLFCWCLFSAQYAAAYSSRVLSEIAGQTSASPENLEATGELAGSGNNVDMYLTARSAHKSRNGKNYVYSFNRYGQLISVKRIGGVERQFAYSNQSAHVPQLVKIGEQPWMQLPQRPYTKSDLQTINPDNASFVSQQMEMGATDDLNTLLSPTQYEAAQKSCSTGQDGAYVCVQDDEYAGMFDWLMPMFGQGFGNSGWGAGGGEGDGYCQTRHCSFPSLAACMADCDRTKDWGQVACNAFGVTPPPPWGGIAAVSACQVAINSAYHNICKPGCEAGNR
jgi:hypothetical protein